MTAAEFLAANLTPGIAWYASLPSWTIPTDDRARLMLLVIPGQESQYENVRQSGGGPGLGPYQFEPETCDELVMNPASRPAMRILAEALGIPVGELDGAAFYDRILSDTRLAVALARLDLWCDPRPLVTIGDEEGAWRTYVRVWGPGAVIQGGARAIKARNRWTANYKAAMTAMKE